MVEGAHILAAYSEGMADGPSVADLSGLEGNTAAELAVISDHIG